jgi:TfoX/Sxy family transcriptional regulator of competence genes
MFGNVAAFVNGNMFMGLFGADIGLRLAETDRDALLAVEGLGPFGPPDRPMKEYVAMPASRQDDQQVTAAWIRRALENTAAMPPK